MIKQMMFGLIVFIAMNSVTFTILEACESKNFVFKNGMNTYIGGDSIHRRLNALWWHSQPDPVFKYTRIVMLKNKQFKEIGTLDKIAKNHHFIDSDEFSEIKEHGNMNNAIYCYDVEQMPDYDDKLCNVGAVIFGTRNLEYCSLFKQYVENTQSKNNKSKEEVFRK